MAQAVAGWTLLASSLSDIKLNEYFNTETPTLRKLLEKKTLEVKSAAGEAIALLYSAHLTSSEKSKVGFLPDIDSLKEQLEALATDGAKHRSREMRKKTAFSIS